MPTRTASVPHEGDGLGIGHLTWAHETKGHRFEFCRARSTSDSAIVVAVERPDSWVQKRAVRRTIVSNPRHENEFANRNDEGALKVALHRHRAQVLSED